MTKKVPSQIDEKLRKGGKGSQVGVTWIFDFFMGFWRRWAVLGAPN